MYKVKAVEIKKCRFLLNSDIPSFSSILLGESKGDIWLDNQEEPTLALVYSHAVGGFSFIGDPEDIRVYEKLKSFLTMELFPMLKENGSNFFEFSVENERTKNRIIRMFSDKNMMQENEYFYRKSTPCRLEDIDEYKIIKIDSSFINQLQANTYENPEFIEDRLFRSWETIKDFLSKSTGYVAIDKNSIVAVIMGTARYQNTIPIDIETNENHRKKGLARALTKYFVNTCVEKGLFAVWNCVDSNIGSRTTVEKAGFEYIRKKPYYWFDI